MVSDIVHTLRDIGRIARKPAGPGVSRLGLCSAYLRLTLMPGIHRRDRRTAFLGYRLHYLEAMNVLQLFREIFVRRTWDVPLTGNAPTIIDCGSNIGMSILFFKHLYPKCRVLGFEPNPLAFAVLRKNVEANGLADVELHQKALSDRPGVVDFYLRANEPGALDVGMFSGRGMTAVTVEADVLSNYVNAEVDLLKIDIEGAEEIVLNDLVREGKIRQVRNIVCEYHHHHRRDQGANQLSNVLSLLEISGFGYQLHAYWGRAPTAFRYQDVLIYAYRADKS